MTFSSGASCSFDPFSFLVRPSFLTGVVDSLESFRLLELVCGGPVGLLLLLLFCKEAIVLARHASFFCIIGHPCPQSRKRGLSHLALHSAGSPSSEVDETFLSVEI